MAINPMELLKQKVSSIIVNDQTCLVNEKNDVLSRFYPIFLHRFLEKPELVDQLKEKLTPSIFDLLEQNDRVKNELLLRLAAGKVAVAEVEITLNRAIPKSLAVLSNEVGNDAISIIHYLREHKQSIHALLPNWSDEVLLHLNEVPEPEPVLEEVIVPAEEPIEKKSYKLFPFLTLIFASFSLLFLYHLSK
ncbi:hypothetical protein GCM10025882_23790 [Acinetobacter gyllenbergii]|uniref:Uncharacterized protein n=1 Tax=Acinetobacter gyllenbergii CIP 110306 = MTCC 11365 TaxID=1217657 RepID=A0A829HQ32_9GAMM|nr:hypothetical protein [Acinetobacter gyllenbergii]EPF93424.1 hypothetical protein F957_00220 [Acinetobacter gyllenbergii CIP 110306 = MTCC 11365]EPH32448.1 Outer membrane lipoprotein omp16 precursor [Acinetobacter gyllenbergii CIP 110306 = MTCC 11365]GMA11954.1 hypothetical protein GCM10025882_23790 [Acinetobacter gyllenbergii]